MELKTRPIVLLNLLHHQDYQGAHCMTAQLRPLSIGCDGLFLDIPN